MTDAAPFATPTAAPCAVPSAAAINRAASVSERLSCGQSGPCLLTTARLRSRLGSAFAVAQQPGDPITLKGRDVFRRGWACALVEQRENV